MVEMVGTRNRVLASEVHHAPLWEREKWVCIVDDFLAGGCFITSPPISFYFILSFWSLSGVLLILLIGLCRLGPSYFSVCFLPEQNIYDTKHKHDKKFPLSHICFTQHKRESLERETYRYFSCNSRLGLYQLRVEVAAERAFLHSLALSPFSQFLRHLFSRPKSFPTNSAYLDNERQWYRKQAIAIR